MTFEHLLEGAEFLSVSGNPDVSSVEYDSRRVKPGCAFVAMREKVRTGIASSTKPSGPGRWRSSPGFSAREAARRGGVGAGAALDGGRWRE